MAWTRIEIPKETLDLINGVSEKKVEYEIGEDGVIKTKSEYSDKPVLIYGVK